MSWLWQPVHKFVLVVTAMTNDHGPEGGPGVGAGYLVLRHDTPQMRKDARAGFFCTIIAYTSGRLTRWPREHEDQICLTPAWLRLLLHHPPREFRPRAGHAAADQHVTAATVTDHMVSPGLLHSAPC
jgi:hypothetical protein